MDKDFAYKLFELRNRIVGGAFDEGNWEELGILTEGTSFITRHPRLLRSLSWGDEDYSGCVLSVLRQIIERDHRTFSIIEEYLDRQFPGKSTFVSAKPSERTITFAPYVFEVPDTGPDLDLVAVMMPFSSNFQEVYTVIKGAVEDNHLRCLRADDIWEEATIVQEIFGLIYKAQVVVVDFSGRNSNVMYETGIAHTLGKHVIPISQSLDDVPFDMRHHRVLKYLGNSEGLGKLRADLAKKLAQFALGNDAGIRLEGEDLPF